MKKQPKKAKYPRYYIVEGATFYRRVDYFGGCFFEVFDDGEEYPVGITNYDAFEDHKYGVKARKTTAAEIALKFGFVK